MAFNQQKFEYYMEMIMERALQKLMRNAASEISRAIGIDQRESFAYLREVLTGERENNISVERSRSVDLLYRMVRVQEAWETLCMDREVPTPWAICGMETNEFYNQGLGGEVGVMSHFTRLLEELVEREHGNKWTEASSSVSRGGLHRK